MIKEQPFPPENFVDFHKQKCPTILIKGSRGSGKTTMCIDLMNKLSAEDKYDVCIIFTEKNKFTDFKPTNFNVIKFNDELNEEMLENILYRQRHLNDNKKISKVMLIIDNMSNFAKIKNTETYRDLILNSRCYNVSLIIAVPSSTGFSPDIRYNMDYIFLLNEQSLTVKQKLYEHYGGMFPSLEYFEEIFYFTTRENYNCLVLNTCYGTDLNKKVMQYKASSM